MAHQEVESSSLSGGDSSSFFVEFLGVLGRWERRVEERMARQFFFLLNVSTWMVSFGGVTVLWRDN
jgi:hypothetical protein